MMKTCPACGETLSEEAKFCPVDGTSLHGVAPTAAPPPASGGPAFSKTLYFGGGVPAPAPPPPAAPAASPQQAAYFPPPPPPSDDLDMPVSKHADVDIQVTPSEPMRAHGQVAAATPSGPSSMAMERPKGGIGLIFGAALAGAAFVGLLALGAKLLRGRKAAPAAVAEAPAAVVASQPPPAAPPPLPATASQGTPDAGRAPAPPGLDAGSVPAAPATPPAAAPAPAKDSLPARRAPPPAKTPAPPPPVPAGTTADPQHAEIYIRAGREHLSRGAYSKAQLAFEQARAYDPASAAALAGLGEVAFEQNRYDAAIEKLRAAVRLNRNSRYLTLLGNCYFKAGRYKHAVDQYKGALKLEPANKEAADGLQAAQQKLRGP